MQYRNTVYRYKVLCQLSYWITFQGKVSLVYFLITRLQAFTTQGAYFTLGWTTLHTGEPATVKFTSPDLVLGHIFQTAFSHPIMPCPTNGAQVIVDVHLVWNIPQTKRAVVWYIALAWDCRFCNIPCCSEDCGPDHSGVSEHSLLTRTALGAHAEEWDNNGHATQNLDSKVAWLQHNLWEDMQVKSCWLI